MAKKDLIKLAVMSPNIAEKIMDDGYWKKIFTKKTRAIKVGDEDE